MEDYLLRVQVFDLALIKSVASQSDTPLIPGTSVVTFTITISNQGTITATNVVVVDYVPALLTYSQASNAGWSANTTTPTRTLASPLAPGTSTDIQIVLSVPLAANGQTITNTAEIANAADDKGTPITDIDSTPDNLNTESPVKDDVTNENGRIPGQDEDDHDIAVVGARELVAIGNLVWYDTDNDGVFDSGEQPISGVTVTLFYSGGNPLSGTPVRTTTTDVSGRYVFDNLLPGAYFVFIGAENFQNGGTLAGYFNSTDAGNDETSDQNLDENGIDDPAPATNGIRSRIYDLQPNTEPVNDEDTGYTGILGDNSVNMTADFGFYTLKLGDFVWRDDNNNGVRDAGEPGVDGVLVVLRDTNGNVVSTTVTSAGFYTFTGLAAGTYTVAITPTVGYRSSTVDEAIDMPTDDTGAGVADNGVGSSDGVIVSTPFTLTAVRVLLALLPPIYRTTVTAPRPTPPSTSASGRRCNSATWCGSTTVQAVPCWPTMEGSTSASKASTVLRSNCLTRVESDQHDSHCRRRPLLV